MGWFCIIVIIICAPSPISQKDTAGVPLKCYACCLLVFFKGSEASFHLQAIQKITEVSIDAGHPCFFLSYITNSNGLSLSGVHSAQFLSSLCAQCVWYIQEVQGSGLWEKNWNKFSVCKGLSVVNAFSFIHRCRRLRLIRSLFAFINAFSLEAEEYTLSAKSPKSLNVFESVCTYMFV